MLRGGCTSRLSPSCIPVLIPCSVSVEYGWEWRGNFGLGSSKCRGCFGTEAEPCWLCCSIPAALIQGFLWKHRCSALHVQVAMAPLISICRECWGLDGGQGNSPCVRWQRRAAEKENGRDWRSAVTSQSHTAVWGGSQALPALSAPHLPLDCAAQNKRSFLSLVGMHRGQLGVPGISPSGCGKSS